MANKKYTIGTLMASIPETKTEVRLEGDYFKDVTINVKRTIDLEDSINFAKNVSATCIDEESSDYMPELFDFAMKLYTVMYYANIDLTKDVKKAYKILYGTSLFRQICNHIDEEQLYELISAAESRIEYLRDIMSSSLAGKFSELMNKIDDMMGNSAEMMEAIDSDGFKDAVARLVDSNVMKEANAAKIMADKQIEGSITADDMDMAHDLMKGMQQESPDEGNVVYIKKKK